MAPKTAIDWNALIAQIEAFLKLMTPWIGTDVVPIVEAWLTNMPGVPAWVITAVEALLTALFPNNPAARLRTSGITKLP